MRDFSDLRALKIADVEQPEKVSIHDEIAKRNE
jgi:hypothetical protein